jgi:hypothetical protein
MLISEKLQMIYEYDGNFFSYMEIAKDRWNDLLHDAMKFFKVHFDLENNDTCKTQKIIVIPQKEWEFTQCKFKCELCEAGGDWEIPVYYFKCQLVDGYAFGVEKYHSSGLFIFIPGKKEGNYHLVSKDGGEWVAPHDGVYEEGIDPKANERDCWKSLEIYLKKLVDLEIEKVNKEREERQEVSKETNVDTPEGEPQKDVDK